MAGRGTGGEGLPYRHELLRLWGGEVRQAATPTPAAPTVFNRDASGEHQHGTIAVVVRDCRTGVVGSAAARGLDHLRWESVLGADHFIIVRDGHEIARPHRLEGAQQE